MTCLPEKRVNRPGIAGDRIPREDGAVAQPSRYSPEVRRRAVWMAFRCERPVGPVEQRPYGRLFYTPYWATSELPPIDMKSASVGILDQIAAGLRWITLR
jgi:hypothetical protein